MGAIAPSAPPLKVLKLPVCTAHDHMWETGRRGTLNYRLPAQLTVFFSGYPHYPAMGDHPILLEWYGSATVSRSVWELVEGFLEGTSRLLGSGGGRKSVPICNCPWEK